MDTMKTRRMARIIRLDVAAATALLALPIVSGAASFPSYPLQSGASQVPPNILFILDDSGSMGSLRMPTDTYGELGDTIALRSSSHNTVYYNPTITYRPWMTAQGTRMTGGTSFRAVYPDYDLAGGADIDLADEDDCSSHTQNGSWVEVCGGPGQATYYVLKSGQTADASKRERYDRYQIRLVGGAVRVVRSEWAKSGSTSNSLGCPDPGKNTFGWRNCTYATPTGRSEADEATNFATWFSYHRSRMKMAKAGAMEAFGLLGSNMRVGYRSIWNRDNFDIPVADGNSGLFEDVSSSGARTNSRSTWFARVAQARNSGNTPLQGALQRAGAYFSDPSASGPYGPEAPGSQYQCRQNFSILTTDGYWNNSWGYTAVGEQDSHSGPSIYNPIDDTNAVRYVPAPPYSAAASDTLGDIAMRYWKNDLRTDLDNLVPSTPANPAFWQHMATFGISIGLKGSLDQTSVAEVVRDGSPRKNGVNVAWPTPGSGKGVENIDDLLHAAVNGHGEFIAATNAEAFGEALNSVLGQIQARLASGSNVSTNSTSFQSDSRMYQATYMAGQWSGDIVARDVTAAGGISASEAWRVSNRIERSLTDGDTRNDFHTRPVLTWNGSRGVDFPTNSQESTLGRSTGAAIVSGEDNAAYIKGDRSNEKQRGGVLRNRSILLGDIVNSSPFYVKETNTLYVGANDGMLHAIHAGTGDVLFSYVPAGLDFAKLATLSDPNYQHAFFVDGPVAVASQSSAGDNYLVGSLGRGGKGVFALDVSNVSRPEVLWDKTAASDNDMGHVIGTPMVTKSNTGAAIAVVGNGIDSANGSAALYIYDVQGGSLLRKIVVDTGGNGLFAPRGADTNGDGRVDYVYAGDLKGNLWKFDVSGTSASSWNVALSGAPLFRTGTGQPITGGLAIAQEPGNRRIWITFGTGRLISTTDLGSTGTQSLYGIIDNQTTAISGRGELTQRRIAAVGTNAAGRSVRAFEYYSPLPAGSRGWYIDLGVPTAGERVVSGPRVRGRAAWYSSVIPDSGSGCEPGGTGYLNVLDLFTGTSPSGTGEGNSTSFFDFDSNGTGNNDTTPGSGGNMPIGSVDLGIGMPTESGQIDKVVLVCGSDGKCEDPTTTPPGGAPQRVGWREVLRDN
ncbi:pilus assembly protein [Lysobacter sp. N42]|uniref:pilus assembly protein n=1 Tax=Lysobacter sp. N42 TaxID=2545719 RepID=UPI001047E307|nr:PilC/PilY family type IV pilus protein [Lysobacter sp. N42]TCZ88658.1 pilus assembly protein [Lysobacter sp. N42]